MPFFHPDFRFTSSSRPGHSSPPPPPPAESSPQQVKTDQVAKKTFFDRTFENVLSLNVWDDFCIYFGFKSEESVYKSKILDKINNIEKQMFNLGYSLKKAEKASVRDQMLVWGQISDGMKKLDRERGIYIENLRVAVKKYNINIPFDFEYDKAQSARTELFDKMSRVFDAMQAMKVQHFSTAEFSVLYKNVLKGLIEFREKLEKEKQSAPPDPQIIKFLENGIKELEKEKESIDPNMELRLTNFPAAAKEEWTVLFRQYCNLKDIVSTVSPLEDKILEKVEVGTLVFDINTKKFRLLSLIESSKTLPLMSSKLFDNYKIILNGLIQLREMLEEENEREEPDTTILSTLEEGIRDLERKREAIDNKILLRLQSVPEEPLDWADLFEQYCHSKATLSPLEEQILKQL